MKVVIKYADIESLTSDEVVRRNLHLYGPGTEGKVYPSSNDPWDLIYFGIQQLITQEQLELLYDSGALYDSKLNELRKEMHRKLGEELCQVIMDNEKKVE
jgi:hypothetical protein